jgi:hypothetical protein
MLLICNCMRLCLGSDSQNYFISTNLASLPFRAQYLRFQKTSNVVLMIDLNSTMNPMQLKNNVRH